MDKGVLMQEIKDVIKELKVFAIDGEKSLSWDESKWRTIIDRGTKVFHFTNHSWVTFHNKAGVVTGTSSKEFNVAVKEDLINILETLLHEIESGSALQEIPISDKLLNRISDDKIKILCIELNQNFGKAPNASAMLFRTILLNVLRLKLKKISDGQTMLKESDGLKGVIDKCIANDVYGDKHIKRFLEKFSQIPKDIYDADVHSDWILVEQANLDSEIGGLKLILEKSFDE
ncbi:MAG: hypothetical protein V1846_01080 [Candidatus Komeilibacteria bacterium]